MSVHGDSDTDDVTDPVTLISKLDVSNPLHLHSNDSAVLTVVSVKLKGTENYQVWANAMLLTLEGKNKIGFIDGSCKKSITDVVLAKQWDRVNAVVLGWILNSISGELSFILSRETLPDVKVAYAIISSEESHRMASGSVSGPSQRAQTSAFLSNGPARNNFQINQNSNSNNFRPNNSTTGFRPNNPNPVRLNMPSNAELVCENCGYNEKKNVAYNSVGSTSGSTSSTGFTDEQLATLLSLIKDNTGSEKNVQANMAGIYFNSNKVFNDNFEKFFCFNSNIMSRMGYNGKIVDSGANQHMTNSEKELDNIYDISHLNIKVAHPNGTNAIISKIGNLRLPNGLVLFDVLVIPEYCVTLVSVHKLAKDNKIFVVFDENKCFFVNQDLNLKNVLGTGKQCGGLYYLDTQGTKCKIDHDVFTCSLSFYDWHCRLGHPGDPALDVLKGSLKIDKNDKCVFCEICQRAKQTRKPFPLSDHKTKLLGEIVHLDLWGPYKGFIVLIDINPCFRDVMFFESIFPVTESVSIGNKVDSLRVESRINRDLSSQSDISHYYKKSLGNNVNTADSPITGDISHGSDDIDARLYEDEAATLDENLNSEGNVDSNPSTPSHGIQTLRGNLESNLNTPAQGTQNLRRSTRSSIFPRNYNDFVVNSKVKYGIEKFVGYSKLNAVKSVFSPQWVDAMNLEMSALLENDTWDLVELPKGRKALSSKWVWKLKFKSSGEIERYKARLVAMGCAQKEGVDYEETFSPVVKMVTIRCLVNLAVNQSWPIFQLDINNAFLYGDLEETVYMKPPQGFYPGDDNIVCRLKKSIYGLKQAPRQWNAKLTSVLVENGFCQSKSDYSLYTKSVGDVFLALLVYVDDIIVTGNNAVEIDKFKVFLKGKFKIKDLGKLKYFLGIEVVDTKSGISLNQRKYVLDLLSEYGMLACKPSKTPLMSKLSISNEPTAKDPLLVNIVDYQKLMGKLIYLTNTRPDISYVVHCLSQFMHSPLNSHLKIAFKILRYLKGSPGLGIHFSKESGMSLKAYSDADWAKCVVTRKSVTGYYVFINDNLISWKSKKQNTLSKSSAEAEYRALASVTSEVI
ncbi:ribonuclease H-like domain-containing protein [Tanacetum coccineum]